MKLTTIGSSLSQEGTSTDIQYLEQADSITQALMELSPNNGCAWALLCLVYADRLKGLSALSEEEADVEGATTNIRNARFKALQLCEAAQAQGLEGLGSNFFLQVRWGYRSPWELEPVAAPLFWLAPGRGRFTWPPKHLKLNRGTHRFIEFVYLLSHTFFSWHSC